MILQLFGYLRRRKNTLFLCQKIYWDSNQLVGVQILTLQIENTVELNLSRCHLLKSFDIKGTKEKESEEKKLKFESNPKP